MNKNNNTPAHICTYIGTGSGCTAQALEGTSYCAEHYALVYKVGSGKQRKKDTRQADRVRLVETLFQEAIDQLIIEGFDVYGDHELAPVVEIAEFDDR
jgi:hypothetical protein